MKTETHIRIAEAIAKHLGMDCYEREKFVEAVAYPDRRRVFFMPGVPHHRPYLFVLKHLIWKSRKALINNDRLKAIWYLGNALHYVQDKCVYEDLLKVKHNRIEERLLNYDVPVGAIEEGIRNACSSPRCLWRVIKSIKGAKEEGKAIYNATYYSSLVLSSVLNLSKKERPEWDELVSRLREEKAKLTKGYYALMLTLVFCALTSMLYVVGVIGQLLLLGLCGILSIGAVLATRSVNRVRKKYLETKEELAWNNARELR